MKILFPIIGLVAGLALGLGFGALLLAGLGLLIAWAIKQQNEAAERDQRQFGSQAARPALARNEDEIPDPANRADLRNYLGRLGARVRALEREIALLKGEPAAAAEPAPGQPSVSPEPAPIPAAPPAYESPLYEPPPPVEAPRSIEPQPAVEPQPAAPAQPSFVQRLITENIVAKVGAIVLFFGVGFLLKFAYDHGMMPPELRLAGVALAAVAVFVVGGRLGGPQRLYGLILQGVASGLAYLDVFFALKTYGFIGPVPGFALFAALGVATTMLAVRRDAAPLAVLGLAGAFLAPILASTGSGSHVLLFSYYLLLNLFILAVSWFKAWRALNLTGWFFTFAVGVFWGAGNYRPELFTTVEPFLVVFFAIYLVVPILFATRQPPELKGVVDGTLVFGTPAAVAFMQARLAADLPYGLAWSAAAGALLYAVLSPMVLRHRNMRLLGETYIALAVGLGTLAVFFAFGAYTTFALWTIEGAAILWVGLRQNRMLARLFGLLVQLAGAAYFFLDYDLYLRFNPVFNDAILGCAIIAGASLLSAALLRRFAERLGAFERILAGVVPAWGALWWSLGGVDAIHHAVTGTLKPAALILFFSASVAAIELAGARAKWTALRGLSVVHPAALLGAALLQLTAMPHPLANLGWLAWPLGLGSLSWILHRQRRDGFDAGLELRYAGGWVILAGVATWEAGWLLARGHYLWCLLLSTAGYAAGVLRYRLREQGAERPQLSALALLWAMFFWFAAGFGWIHERLPVDWEIRAALLFVSASAVAYELLHGALRWPALRWAARLPWLAIPGAVIVELGVGTAGRPFAGWIGLAWPLVWAAAVWALRREEREGLHLATGFRHAVALYLPLVLLSWELAWWLSEWRFGTPWRLAALAVPPIAAMLVLVVFRDTPRWPLREHWPLYRDALLGPVAGLLALWTLFVNLRAPGSLQPLSLYLPLLNPADATMAAAAIALAAWVRSLDSEGVRGTAWRVLAVLGFVWVNAIALRTIHYWANVPYQASSLMSSVLVQATLSILWTSFALAMMVVARRRMQRRLWIVGAALLAVVVGKLFLIDLANTATVARIVSFLGVGVMLLVIGYVAPVPPGAKQGEG